MAWSCLELHGLGGYHGFLLATERYISYYIKLPQNLFLDLLKIVVVFSFVTLGWLLFKLPEFGQAVKYLLALGGNFDMPHSKDVLMMIFFYSLPIMVYYANYLLTQKTNKNYMNNSIVYALLLFAIVTNSGSSGEFIYFQF